MVVPILHIAVHIAALPLFIVCFSGQKVSCSLSDVLWICTSEKTKPNQNKPLILIHQQKEEEEEKKEFRCSYPQFLKHFITPSQQYS